MPHMETSKKFILEENIIVYTMDNFAKTEMINHLVVMAFRFW